MNQYDVTKYRYNCTHPESIAWDITNRCNLRCKHCYNSSGDSSCHDFSDELNKEQAINLAQQIVAIRVPQMCICGGEALLCPHIFDVMDILADGGVVTNIVSNGLLIDERIAKKLQKYKIGNIQISIDGLGYQHDIFRNSRGSFEQAINAVNILVAKGIKPHVSCCPNKYNHKTIVEYVDFICKLGCSKVRFMPLLPMGRAANNLREIMLTSEELFEFVHTLSKLRSKYKRIEIEWGDPLEHLHTILLSKRRNPHVLNIKSNGDVGITPYLNIIVGNVKEKPLQQLWKDGCDKVLMNKEVLGVIKEVQTIFDFEASNQKIYRIEL